MYVPWQVNIVAADRWDVLTRIARTPLPSIAKRHLTALVMAEDYVWGAWRNPHGPLRVFGHGADVGDFIFIDEIGVRPI